MVVTPTHSRDSSSMIDMSDIQAALEMVKGGSRADSSTSLVSWASHGTAALTPSTSPQQVSSGNTSPCNGSVCRSGLNEAEGARSDRRPTVRWSDECGLDLVTQVQTATDFWDELVFGPKGCTCIVSNDGSNRGTRTTTSDSSDTTTSGSSRCACGGCGGEGRRQPGELFHFIEELSRGVEATLLFPSMGGISKKRRPVILYTEDNGESICWIKTGGAAGGGSKEPYRIRCNTLVAIKDKSGAASRARERLAGGPGSAAVADDLDGGGSRTGCRPGETSSKRGVGGGGGVGNQDQSRAPSRLSESGDEGRESEARGAAGGEGGGDGGGAGVEVKVKWLPQPTWSKRSVTVADVKTRCPGMFTRGMLQLLSFNTDLQS